MKGFNKSFPVLASLAPEKQDEVLEQARSETFRVKGNSGKWALTFVGMLLLGFIIPLGLSSLFDVDSSWIRAICSGLGFFFAFYLYNRNYVKLIAPKVKEIAAAV